MRKANSSRHGIVMVDGRDDPVQSRVGVPTLLEDAARSEYPCESKRNTPHARGLARRWAGNAMAVWGGVPPSVQRWDLRMTNLETKPAEQASIPELIDRLTTQTSRLVRDEIQLAQKEFQLAAKRTGIGAGLFSTAGLLAFTGLLAVVTAAIAALALVLPVWAAAAIVAVVLLAAAGIAAVIGKKQVEQAPA